MTRTRLLALVVAATVATAPPPCAGAQGLSELGGPTLSPGSSGQRGTSIVNHGGQLFTVTLESCPGIGFLRSCMRHVLVWRYDERDDYWAPVGNLLNDSVDQDADNPSLASVNGSLYVVWQEHEPPGVWRIHAARLEPRSDDMMAWHAIDTTPLNADAHRDAIEPWVAEVAGVPYVAWRELGPLGWTIRASRLNYTAGRWELVGGDGIVATHVHDAERPYIIEDHDQPVVYWLEGDELRRARLRPEQPSWTIDWSAPTNRVTPHGATASGPTDLAVARYQLGATVAAWTEADAADHQQVYVHGWTALGSPSEDAGVTGASDPAIATIGGEIFAAFVGRPLGQRREELTVMRYRGGLQWERIPTLVVPPAGGFARPVLTADRQDRLVLGYSYLRPGPQQRWRMRTLVASSDFGSEPARR